MSKSSQTTHRKRERERNNQERQQEKRAERALRKEMRKSAPRGESAEDPDIAGIVPGPQPPQEF
jgi:hypothetical protein